MPESLLLNGRIISVKYHNEDTGYCVLACECAGEEIVLVGHCAYAAAGMGISAEGEYINHPNYGRQFSAQVINADIPVEKNGIYEFLSGGTIKGLGKVTAERLVGLFGDRTLEVIENEPMKLTAAKGITPVKARQMSESFKGISSVAKAIAQLQGFDLEPRMAVMLYRQLGPEAAAIVRENPYIMCGEQFGMDFARADDIAASLGIGDDDCKRIAAGIIFVLNHNLQNGHTFAPEAPLVRACANLLSAPDFLIEEEMQRQAEGGALIRADFEGINAVYLKSLYTAEDGIVEALLRLESAAQPADIDINGILSKQQESLGIVYADLQRRAIRDCVRSGVFILTGGPGTGKTTALNGIIGVFTAMGLEIALAAPTGRAAKRMTELTGFEAKTVHRLLEMDYGSGGMPHFRRDRKNPIAADVIIIDETSMLDVLLANALLAAVKDGSRVVFVGDSNQLPPVGAGNFLKDMIASERFTVVELTEIFRQARDSLIVVNAHQLLMGEAPELSEKASDFFFLPRADRPSVAETVVSLCAVRLPKNLQLHPFNDIQVLCASKKGDIGTHALNVMLQNALNPARAGAAEVRRENTVIRAGDKVMQIVNNYDMLYVKEDTGEIGTGVFNGDIGAVLSIDKMSETVKIQFDDRIYEYLFEGLSQIEHAYAITVHKAQGSEFRAVVMPVWFGSDKLQSRNLLYTAVTRAKEDFILVGSKDAVLKMAANNRENKRYCGLIQMLNMRGGF